MKHPFFKRTAAFFLFFALLTGLSAASGTEADDGGAERYVRGAMSVERDWKLKDIISFEFWFTDAPLSLPEGEGVFMETGSGVLRVSSAAGSVMMPIDGDSDKLVRYILDKSLTLGNVGVYTVGAAPGVFPEEQRKYAWYFALGAVLAAGIHADTALPVLWQREEGWTVFPEDQCALALEMYAALSGDAPTDRPWAPGRPEEGGDGLVRDLKAHNYMRMTMIDHEYHTREELDYPAGAYVIDDPDDLALLISDGENVDVFWFLNAVDTRLLLGYTAAAFYQAGCGHEDYTLLSVAYDENDEVSSARILTAEEKEAALADYLSMDIGEALSAFGGR